ncbi:MAG: hypothetical protein ABI967_03100 [bacterium]
MLLTITTISQVETAFREPTYFAPMMLTMLGLGAVLWLVAAVLGFARAKAFGPSARWFTFAAVSLILFHLQFIALGFGLLTKDNSIVFGLLTFFDIFVIIAGCCAIMGFVRLTNPR